jgi:transketolase
MVFNVHTIKPLDEPTITEAAKRCGAVVTVEEHQITGGLGSAVAELLAREQPTPIEYIGLADTFGESGKPDELIERYGMGENNIIAAVKRVVRRK